MEFSINEITIDQTNSGPENGCKTLIKLGLRIFFLCGFTVSTKDWKLSKCSEIIWTQIYGQVNVFKYLVFYIVTR